MNIRPVSTRRALLGLPAALCATALSSHLGLARAQSGKPVSFVVPVPAGGGMDVSARLVGENVRDALGLVIVENKPGAALRLALQAVRTAAPDGNTLLYTAVSPFTIYPYIYQKPGYSESDFVPIVPAVAFDFAIGVPASSPITTLAQYLEAVRRDPERNGLYGVPAAGSAAHFVGAALASAAGLKMAPVAYRGSAPLMNDLMGGHLAVATNVLGEFIPHRGKVRVLATTGAARSPLMSDVPTFTELGYPNLVLGEQFGLFAPKGTPPATINRINGAVQNAVRQPDVQKRLGEMGYTPMPMTAEAFATKLAADRAKWGPIIAATGFKAEE
jgi:tripartite-type tricarboxylate transporter receptor subunit TctC